MNHQNTKAPNEAEAEAGGTPALPVDPARGPHIFDFRGRPVHLLDPRPEDVHPEVIAHSLALQCRYGGHCPRFLSVAEHSLLVAEVVAREHPELALAALLHDAHEAITTDLPAPLKRLITGVRIDAARVREWETFADGWQTAIHRRFGLPARLWDAVETDGWAEIIHAADLAVGAAEMLSFGWSGPTPGRESAPAEGITIEHWRPYVAEQFFLFRLAELLGADDPMTSDGLQLAEHETTCAFMSHLIEGLLAQRAEASSAPPAGSDARPTEEAQP